MLLFKKINYLQNCWIMIVIAKICSCNIDRNLSSMPLSRKLGQLLIQNWCFSLQRIVRVEYTAESGRGIAGRNRSRDRDTQETLHLSPPAAESRSFRQLRGVGVEWQTRTGVHGSRFHSWTRSQRFLLPEAPEASSYRVLLHARWQRQSLHAIPCTWFTKKQTNDMHCVWAVQLQIHTSAIYWLNNKLTWRDI